MSQNLPPPPLPEKDLNSFSWKDWFRKVRSILTETGSIAWSILDFTGSNLTDLETRNHNDLQNIQGGTTNKYYHLLDTQHGLFTSGTANQVLHGSATLPTWGNVVAADAPTLVPYTGATADVNLGANTLSGESISITGTGGLGFLDLIAQASNPASPAAGTARIHSATTQGFTRVEQDNEAATNLVLGRDTVFIAKNTSGSTITKGQVVYITGSTGNAPNIGLARANSLTTLPAVGIVLDSIENNNFGQVMYSGIISNVDTSAFATGATLWVSTSVAGALQNTRATTPNLVQRMGTVLVSGVGNGSILIVTAPFLVTLETNYCHLHQNSYCSETV